MRNPVLLATLLGVLLLPNVASANGPCGQDFDGNHACGITSPASDNGSLTTANESDFYVFYARQGTELHLTLTNTQDPSCSTGGPESCGNPFMELDDARGNEIAESNTSVPNNGVTVPATMDITLQATGTYYVQVEFAGCCLGPPEENGNEQPDPYTLSVSASPNVQWPPPAPPVKVKSSPSAGADRHGDQYVTWQGTDGGLWERWYVGGRWYGPAKISNAGTIASAPAIAVHANGEQDIFWRGNDGNLWEAWYSGRWHGAVSINSGQLGSGPAAGVDSRGDQFVYWQGTDGGLWERWYMAGRWHGPVRIGNAGTIASAPTVAVHANGEQDVFWRGTDGNLWEAWHTNRWHGAVKIDSGRLGSGPAAGVDSRGDQFVYWQGTDGGLWERWYMAGRWHGPARIGNAGTIASTPTVAVHANGEQDVFWRGTDGNLWEAWFTSGWSGAVAVGG